MPAVSTCTINIIIRIKICKQNPEKGFLCKNDLFHLSVSL